MRAPLWMLSLNRWYGVYLDESSLGAHKGGGVKSSHDIQSLRLFFKKWVTFVGMFICIMDEVANQGVFHYDSCLSNVIFHVEYDKTLCFWGVWMGMDAQAKKEPRSIFACWSKDKEQHTNYNRWCLHGDIFHMCDTLLALLDGTIRRLPMQTHVTSAYSINMFVVAIGGKCTNDTMYFLQKLIRVHLNIISTQSCNEVVPKFQLRRDVIF